ncbi:MAG: LacI family DNA-binding transcriptional regulator [Lachnospiraceae bacterium]|nr:LacI family DNA-binding transcriptional regulator [Lachnospiraceae bacterium]
MLSIKDIAAISGVSIAAVSRILNNKGRYPQ